MKNKNSNNNKITIHLPIFPWENYIEREGEKYSTAIKMLVSIQLQAWPDRSHFPFKTTWQMYHDSITVVIENASFIVVVVLPFVLHYFHSH
jgi:hypothetical protein